MKVYYSGDFKYHFGFDSSLENAKRIEKVLTTLKAKRLVQWGALPLKWEKIVRNLVLRYRDKPISCHKCTYTSSMKTVAKSPDLHNRCEMCQSELKPRVKFVSNTEGDTTFMCETSEFALTSLLTSLKNFLDTWNREESFILSRPPGHHSDNENPSGFCLVNNIAFVAEQLMAPTCEEKSPNKVCILDWDVHQGDGTYKLFHKNPDVLLVDIHRENFYPYTAFPLETENTLNFPLPKGSTEKEYLEVLNKAIFKIEKFKPDYILVSCGFDAHKSDPIGGMLLESTSFSKFQRLLRVLRTPTLYLLEGGYDPDVITDCVLEMTK